MIYYRYNDIKILNNYIAFNRVFIVKHTFMNRRNNGVTFWKQTLENFPDRRGESISVRIGVKCVQKNARGIVHLSSLPAKCTSSVYDIEKCVDRYNIVQNYDLVLQNILQILQYLQKTRDYRRDYLRHCFLTRSNKIIYYTVLWHLLKCIVTISGWVITN